jgi:hypothetical protein
MAQHQANSSPNPSMMLKTQPHHFGNYGTPIYLLCRATLTFLQSTMSSVPSVKMVELNHYWIKAGAIPRDWQPQFYHCGAYNQTMDSFPVLRSHHHIIYIPASSKPLCRFLQHAMYALWYLSLCKRFNEQTRANFHRGSAYLHHLREAFFHEVREKFYASTDDAKSTDGDQPMDDDQPIDDYLSMYDDHIDEEDPQEMPACNKMTRQWFSSILFSWAQAIYHTHKLSPPDSTWLPPNPEIDQTSPTLFGERYICPVSLCYECNHRLGKLVEVA